MNDTSTTTSLHFKIIYHLDRHDIDDEYMTNSDNLRRLRLCLREAEKIDSIVIYSFASPEGPYKNNMRLSEMRGLSAKNRILEIAKQDGHWISDNLIKLRKKGENWDDLRIVADRWYNEDDRDALLEILDNDDPLEMKKKEIKNLGKKSWHFVLDNLMPVLRSSEIVCIYRQNMEPIQFAIPVASRYPEFVPESPAKYYKEQQNEYVYRTRVAVKTNLLYDAVSWLNFSIEVPFKLGDQNFSITYDHQFPWWRWGKGNNEFCMRYLQIGGEARWWFKPLKKAKTKKAIVRDCLAGHFLGIYGMGGKYDFERKRDVCYQGEFWSVGLTYGYSMPISKLFNLEFSASLGYASIPYRHYIPSDDYEILFRDPEKAGTWDYFGITKVGVTLVMPIKFKQKVKTGKEQAL